MRHLRMGPHLGLAGGCVYGAVTVSNNLQDLPDVTQMIDVINVAILGAMAVDNLNTGLGRSVLREGSVS